MEKTKNTSKHLLLFDVDGTLTLSRKKILPEHWSYWKDLSKNHSLGIVGGSDFNKICDQLNVSKDELFQTFHHVFPENGLTGYIYGQEIPKQSLLSFLGEDKYAGLINYVFELFSTVQIPKKRGNFVELRNGMVNISPIGRDCSQEERDEFAVYDAKHHIRNKIVEKLREKFEDYNLDFTIGGQISIDIFPLGWDKTFCLQYIENTFESIHFFGDRTDPGGNDHALYNDRRVKGTKVTSPAETITFVQDLVVKWSRFGKVYLYDVLFVAGKLLATGDTTGYILIWEEKKDSECLPVKAAVGDDEDSVPNKENWKVIKTFSLNSDITYLAWSPCGKSVAVSSNKDELAIFDVAKGSKTFYSSAFRSFVNGISWDPRGGHFLATLSTDRKLDIVNVAKAQKVQSIGRVKFPATESPSFNIPEREFHIFHNSQLITFSRGLSYSPCGELLVAPSGVFEFADKNVNGSFVFSRAGLAEGVPLLFLRNLIPTSRVAFSPVYYKLRHESTANYSGLPYRVVFAICDTNTVHIYDSQTDVAISYVDKIHYDALTDMSWSHDGRMLIISSLEGYNSFLSFKVDGLGEILEEAPTQFSSPQMFTYKEKVIKKRTKKATTKAPENVNNEIGCGQISEVVSNGVEQESGVVNNEVVKVKKATLKFVQKSKVNAIEEAE
uniref:Phosphomannomutase n=1 Tax=Rhabditophanes sp. KR3021 TaxID=114890 RepID=A0AC35TP12_9BILA